MDIEHVRSRFIKHFDGTTGFVYASPGRINLIGEHTDYNGGFVFPGAIDKGMIAEIKPNGTDKVNAYSIDLKDYVTFSMKLSYNSSFTRLIVQPPKPPPITREPVTPHSLAQSFRKSSSSQLTS